MKKGAGVLLPIASLQSKYGIGSFGKSAYEFADLLNNSGQKYWQILPLSPTGYGDSPYQSCSAFAGNPYFIDLETLYQDGLLDLDDLKKAERTGDRIDYSDLFNTRIEILKKAFTRFEKTAEFTIFANNRHVNEYAAYMTLKEMNGYSPFTDWKKEWRNPCNGFIEQFSKDYVREVEFWSFTQYQFNLQWQKLKNYVLSKGIEIIGDIPIYVAFDSVDVWLHSKLFLLNRNKMPKRVAGVPPDYFSATGQLWGNPIYNWNYMKKDGYSWWKDRLDYSFSLYSVVRIDHFRGFDRYYSIPFGREDAKDGEWKKGPSWDLFSRLKGYNIIAEDLGLLDDGVIKLIKKTGYPGMKVLEFAFDGKEDNIYKPSNFTENCIAYSGTHDNLPLAGFIKEELSQNKELFIKDLNGELKKAKLEIINDTLEETELTEEIAGKMLELLYGSRAGVVIVPVQDLLKYGEESRLNSPSTISEKNWSFILKNGETKKIKPILIALTKKFGR